MCKDLQENQINKTKFHEESAQFIEQFKGQIIVYVRMSFPGCQYSPRTLTGDDCA